MHVSYVAKIFSSNGHVRSHLTIDVNDSKVTFLNFSWYRTKCSKLWTLNQPFENFKDAITIRLTIIENWFYKSRWRRIWFNCRNHNPVLFWFKVTYSLNLLLNCILRWSTRRLKKSNRIWHRPHVFVGLVLLSL